MDMTYNRVICCSKKEGGGGGAKWPKRGPRGHDDQDVVNYSDRYTCGGGKAGMNPLQQ